MFYTKNENELIAFGKRLGQALQKEDLIVLTGDLGSGKTTLTKGIAQGLNIAQMIKSPSYTIVREYEGRFPLYHLDVYRIGDDPDSIDLDEFIYGQGVTVIEWGELLDASLLNDFLEIIIDKVDSGRSVTLKSHGKRSEAIAEEMFDANL